LALWRNTEVVGGLLLSYSTSQKKIKVGGAMQYPQLVFGMLAIFTVWS
jgi:FHS family L-fucose permease-like MFS transporter